MDKPGTLRIGYACAISSGAGFGATTIPLPAPPLLMIVAFPGHHIHPDPGQPMFRRSIAVLLIVSGFSLLMV